MRKLTEILGVSHVNPDGSTPTLIEYRIDAPGHDPVELIKRFYRLADYPSSMQPGNLMHLSGANEEGIVLLSVWNNERDAAAAYEELAEPIEAIIEDLGEGSVARVSHSAHRYVLGPGSGIFAADLAELDPDCVAYQIDVPIHGQAMYDLFCEKLEFPAFIPEGLLAHVAGETEAGWRTYTVWSTVEDSQRYFSDRIIPSGVEVVREVGVFPEIRPLEIKPTLFVVNEE